MSLLKRLIDRNLGLNTQNIIRQARRNRLILHRNGILRTLRLLNRGLNDYKHPKTTLSRHRHAILMNVLNGHISGNTRRQRSLTLVNGKDRCRAIVTRHVLGNLNRVITDRIGSKSLLTTDLRHHNGLLSNDLRIAMSTHMNGNSTLILKLMTQPNIMNIRMVARVLNRRKTIGQTSSLSIRVDNLLRRNLRRLTRLTSSTGMMTAHLTNPTFQVLSIVNARLTGTVNTGRRLINKLMKRRRLKPIRIKNTSGH